MDGPVGFEEVRLEEDLEPVSGQPFDRVVDGKNVDPLPVLHVGTFGNGHDIAESNSEIVSNDSVHPDLLVWNGVVAQHDADRLLPFLALELQTQLNKIMKFDDLKFKSTVFHTKIS